MFARQRRCAVALALLLSGSLLACERGKSEEPAAQARPGSPVIELDEGVHDFGIVNENSVLEHQFVVKNAGSAVLTIGSVTSSCGCLTASIGLESIPPGASSPLEVTFDTRMFFGPGSKTIQIDSNDPRHPTSSVEIEYDIQRLLVFEPSYPVLIAKAGRDHVEKIWLAGSLAERAELIVVKVESSNSRQVLARPIGEGLGGKTRKGLALTLRGDKPGTSSGQVTVATGLPKPAAMIVRFSATVED